MEAARSPTHPSPCTHVRDHVRGAQTEASEPAVVTSYIARKLERPVASFPIFALWRKNTGAQPLVDAALAVAPGS